MIYICCRLFKIMFQVEMQDSLRELFNFETILVYFKGNLFLSTGQMSTSCCVVILVPVNHSCYSTFISSSLEGSTRLARVPVPLVLQLTSLKTRRHDSLCFRRELKIFNSSTVNSVVIRACMNSFWFYSFITWIYIVPLQSYYSEALRSLAWLKRAILGLE